MRINRQTRPRRTPHRLVAPLSILLIASLACSFPVWEVLFPAPTPAPEDTPQAPLETPTPLPPSPPTLVETDPAAGEELPPQGAVRLYFDQPMDRPSVEVAFTVEPAVPGQITWPDPATLQFQPTQPLERDTDYTFRVAATARSAIGLSLTEPVTANLRTSGLLEVSQVSPAPDAIDISTDTPLVVAFNRPVVPLQVEGPVPQPLSLDPAVPGTGEWIDSSLYLFRPESPLPGGVTFTARVSAGLLDLSQGVLPEPFTWSFTTALPRLLEAVPDPDADDVLLDAEIVLTFNQPMDLDSAESAFSLLRDDGLAVSGSFEWTEDGTQVTFSPSALLAYNTFYTLRLTPSARDAGGTPLLTPLESRFHTVDRPAVVSTSPAGGSQASPANPVEIRFSSPMDPASLLRALEITPELEGLSTSWRARDNTLIIFGDYQPRTAYRVTLPQTAQDAFGTQLEAPLNLSFTTTDRSPVLDFARFTEVLTLSAGRSPQVEIQSRNVGRIDFSLYSLTTGEFYAVLREGGLLFREPAARGDLVREWSQSLTSAPNLSQSLSVTLQEAPLPTGLYLLIMDTPDDTRGAQARLIVVRDIELVVKSSLEKAFVWAARLDRGGAAAGLTVRLLDESGDEIARGTTGTDGTVEFDGLVKEDPFVPQFATVGLPGGTPFGLTGSNWSDGIQSYDFGIGLDPIEQPFKLYLYTDRPLYRPGQTVYFRGVLREVEGARYRLPSLSNVTLSVFDGRGDVIRTISATLSEFGTFHGEFRLSDEAGLGFYSIESDYGRAFFDVAAFRKPEFAVLVEPSAQEVAQGDPLTATVRAEFFFGGGASGADVDWVVLSEPFHPPDIPLSIDWFELASPFFGPPAFEPLAEGSGVTGPNGSLAIDIPTDIEEAGAVRLLIEATVTDEGGLQVTGRTSVTLHPAGMYLSLRPERYALRAGETGVVDLESLDWDGDPVPGQTVTVTVERVTWEQIVNEEGQIAWRPSVTLVNQAQVTTEDNGRARFSFRPERGGNFRVRAVGRDAAERTATASVDLWVAGQETGIWRQPAVGRMALVPDRDSYEPGDTARVMVPSPFDGTATALITIERGEVLTYQVTELSGSGEVIEIPLQAEYAPNIFVSVLLLQPSSAREPAAMAMGLIELSVNARAFALQVEVTPERESAEPGETLAYRVQASDAEGQPVRAEVSLALVDLALLSLTEPNTLPPFESFYSRQPLRVLTAASLAVSGEIGPPATPTDGLGGGGGGVDALPEIRREFPDTAYWNASVVTDENGLAQVEVALPDNLTTWRMDARAFTAATQVGDDLVDVVVSKPLLIRPITPRFFTAGDRSSVAAVVHNNTTESLPVEVTLEAQGASLVTAPSTSLVLPSGGQARIEWEIAVQDGEAVDLTFFASGGGLQDATKPTVGSAQDGGIPVRRFTAPDTAATAGILVEAGERLEIVNLPRRFDAAQGELRLALDPSLGAAVESALVSLQNTPYASTVEIVSRFLPHLAARRAFQDGGFEDRAVAEQIDRTLNLSLQTLVQRQNDDGGWAWWPGGSSDTFVTAYVLFGMVHARQSGALIRDQQFDAAVEYLQAAVTNVGTLVDRAERDRQAFILYVLASAGAGDATATRALAVQRETLSLWGRAVLAQTLAMVAPGEAALETLLSDFQSRAVRSATGANWQSDAEDLRNLDSSVTTTAQIIRALVMLNRESPLLADGARWLLAARSSGGGWASSHETAWAVLALTDWLRASGGLRANYPFSVSLNGQTLASGQATPAALFTTVELTKPIDELKAKEPNQLLVSRGPGEGALYYTAHLTVFRPVEEIAASSRGLTVQRQIFRYDGECGASPSAPCPPADSAVVGDDLLVRVTLIVPTDQYHIVVEDPFPAGAEPVDVNLRTSPRGKLPAELGLIEVLRSAWGWSRFTRAELRDDRLVLFAEFLPAGTYQYTYLLQAAFSGEFRVLPTRAWAQYFPEVYGQGAGEVYVIEEAP